MFIPFGGSWRANSFGHAERDCQGLSLLCFSTNREPKRFSRPALHGRSELFFSHVFVVGLFQEGFPSTRDFFPDYVRTNNYLQCSCIWLANVRTIAVCRTLPKTASLLFFFLKVQCEAQISETSSLFTRGCIVHSGSWRFFIFERERERFEFVLFESRER